MKKDVCKKCLSSYFEGDLGAWSHFDERVWTESKAMRCLFSPASGFTKEVPVDGDPPQWCIYALEHLVLNQPLYEDCNKERVDSREQEERE